MADIPDTVTPSLITWAGGRSRVILAITFTDIVDSTRLARELGDQAMRAVREAHFKQSRRLIAANEGRWVKSLGDGDVAVFSNAEAALDYALALGAEPGHPMLASRVRAGIHLGVVDMTVADIHGNAVNFGARVSSATKAAEIWLSTQAIDHLIDLKAEHHAALRWQEHPGIVLKGFEGTYTLWSLAPAGSGRVLWEFPARSRSPLPLAESNIPEGIVSRHFLGRDEALNEIAAALEGGGGRVAITALYGLRGVGKTVLAAAYAERHRSDYRVIWWIRADTESGLRADLVGLGVRLRWVAQDEKEEPALAAVTERLRQEGDGILLIFDSARDADAIRPWLPRVGASRVIVTSNAPAWGPVVTPVAIPVWAKETGADFLFARTGRETERAAAEALSDALGGLPLAHEMAASYCERTGMSFAQYRRRLDAAPAWLLDSDKDAPPEYHDRLTIAKTFALAIDEAAKLHPAAEPLIVLAALLAPEPIPLFLFAEGRKAFGEPLAPLLADEGLDEVVAALRAFALVDCETIPDERDPTSTTDTIRLHRLVREIAAARTEGEARETARGALIDAMAAVYPGDVHNDPGTWPRARRLDALTLDLLCGDEGPPQGSELAVSRLLDRVATYKQCALADYAQARPLFERALAIDAKVFGPEHPVTAAALNNLAMLLDAQGNLAVARPLYERALALAEKALGPDHPATAARLNNLAGLLQTAGDLTAARPLLNRALAVREKALGRGDPDIAQSLNSLARLLRVEGDLAAARPLLERALAICENAFGPESPYTALTLNNLALVLKDSGDLAAARPLFERALAIDVKVFGLDHPQTVTTRRNLAALLRGA